jgi:pimeloyl-ACP methyl ester carboxylesterase
VASVGGERLEKMRRSFYDRYKDRTQALVRLTQAQDKFFAELESRRPEYEAIKTPALILAGEDDRVISAKVQSKIASILPDSRFEVVPDTGHVVYIERSDVYFGKLREFFAARRPR